MDSSIPNFRKSSPDILSDSTNIKDSEQFRTEDSLKLIEMYLTPSESSCSIPLSGIHFY